MQSLPHRTIKFVVEDFCARSHLRLQDLNAVRLEELVDRIIGILQVRELARSGRARLATCCRQALGNPVVAECAFVRDLLNRMDIAAA